MSADINSLKQLAHSEDLNDVMVGIMGLVSHVDNIAGELIEVLKMSKYKFVVTEKMSLLFWNYLDKIRATVNDDNPDNSFYAATLLVHYEFRDINAEKVLANAIISSEMDKVYTATTILCRQKSPYAKPAILKRMEDVSLPKEAKKFFLERLEDL